MEVMDVFLKRKSIRSYLPQPIEKEKLLCVLEAGRLAPSACNFQGWKFVVVEDPILREKMFDACGGQISVKEAPAILVVCSDSQNVMTCGQKMSTVDCSIALSFMMLQAAQLGLGTCWLGLFDADQVRKILSVPEEYEIVAVSPIGYPAEDGRNRDRKSLHEIVVYDQF